MQLKKAARRGSNRFLASFPGYVICSVCNRAYLPTLESPNCNKRRCPERNRRWTMVEE